MEQFQKILLEVWREACRHIEIGESARAIAAILREYMPLERLAIHRLDAEHARVAIAAVVPDAGDVLPGSQALPASELKRIESWIREAKPMHLAAAHPLPLLANPYPLRSPSPQAPIPSTASTSLFSALKRRAS